MVWKKGESGNTEGRGRANRDKLSRSFMLALSTDFELNGVDAINRVRKSDPASYLRVIASLVPKELEIKNLDENLTDEQLTDVIATLRSAISSGLVREASITENDGQINSEELSGVH